MVRFAYIAVCVWWLYALALKSQLKRHWLKSRVVKTNSPFPILNFYLRVAN